MQPDTDPPLTNNQRHWFELIQQARSSGLSLAEFAKANDINLQHLYQYRYALRKKGLLPAIQMKPGASLFKRIDLKPSVNHMAYRPDRLMLHFPNGLKLEFSADMDVHCLGAVIEKGLGFNAAP